MIRSWRVSTAYVKLGLRQNLASYYSLKTVEGNNCAVLRKVARFETQLERTAMNLRNHY